MVGPAQAGPGGLWRGRRTLRLRLARAPAARRKAGQVARQAQPPHTAPSNAATPHQSASQRRLLPARCGARGASSCPQRGRPRSRQPLTNRLPSPAPCCFLLLWPICARHAARMANYLERAFITTSGYSAQQRRPGWRNTGAGWRWRTQVCALVYAMLHAVKTQWRAARAGSAPGAALLLLLLLLLLATCLLLSQTLLPLLLRRRLGAL